MLAGSLLAVERIFRRKTAIVDPARTDKVLVLEYMLPLGCCVHLTPVYAALKQCRPEINITVATRGLGAQVLRHSLHIDHLIDTPDPLTNLNGATRFLRSGLRTLGVAPDCVLTGASDQRTRIALLAMLAADGWRGGYTLKPALYHRPLEYDRGLSLIANNLRLAALVGCKPDLSGPHVFFSRENADAARAMLREANPEGRPLVVMVTQNSGGQRTGWHTERFVRVIQHAIPDHYRLDEISAEAVIAALDELLHAYPPNEEARGRRVKQSLSQVDHLAAVM